MSKMKKDSVIYLTQYSNNKRADYCLNEFKIILNLLDKMNKDLLVENTPPLVILTGVLAWLEMEMKIQNVCDSEMENMIKVKEIIEKNFQYVEY